MDCRPEDKTESLPRTRPCPPEDKGASIPRTKTRRTKTHNTLITSTSHFHPENTAYIQASVCPDVQTCEGTPRCHVIIFLQTEYTDGTRGNCSWFQGVAYPLPTPWYSPCLRGRKEGGGDCFRKEQGRWHTYKEVPQAYCRLRDFLISLHLQILSLVSSQASRRV